MGSIRERASPVRLLSSTCSPGFFYCFSLFFFCSQSKPQGAGSLWDQIDVHMQCGSQRRSDWMDSVQVGKRGRGRVFTDQSHRVLCQTFLQRHGELIFNLVQHKIVFGLFLGDHPRGGDFRWCNKYMWKYLRGGKFYFPRIYTEKKFCAKNLFILVLALFRGWPSIFSGGVVSKA